MNASSHDAIKEGEFELISGYIVLQLVDKHCIETEGHDHHGHGNHTDHGHGNHTDHGHGNHTDHGHGNHTDHAELPKVGFFIEELFEKFADANGGSEISHEGFEKMYAKLSLGSTASNGTDNHGHKGDGDHDHSGHDHKRRKRRAADHDELKKVIFDFCIYNIYNICQLFFNLDRDCFQGIVLLVIIFFF